MLLILFRHLPVPRMSPVNGLRGDVKKVVVLSGIYHGGRGLVPDHFFVFDSNPI